MTALHPGEQERLELDSDRPRQLQHRSTHVHLHVSEVCDAQGWQAGAVHQDEAAAGDAIGSEALLGREAEGKVMAGP